MLGGAILAAAGLTCGGRLDLNAEGTAILLWLAFVSAAAFTIWTALLKVRAASEISIFNLLVPIFGTILSGVLLGEKIFKIEFLVSILLISTGIALVNLKINKLNQ